MNQRLTAFVVLACSALPLSAQDPADMGPPEQLEAYAPLLGSWSGSGAGKAEMPAGAMDFKWTGESTYELVMNGFFVRESTRIEVDTMGTLLFENYLGYDKDRQCHVVCGVSNMGSTNFSTIHWLGENQMFTSATMLEGDMPSGERWTTTIHDDTLEMTGRKWLGSGDEIRHVWGEMHRTDDVAPHAADASASVMPVAPEMEKLARLCGDYRLEGKVQMAPGTTVPVTATDSTHAIYGGAVIEINVTGDPMPGAPYAYAGWGGYAWDPTHDCYSMVWVDNFGVCSQAQMRWVGDALVATTRGRKFGQPMVRRSVLKLTDDGKLDEVEEHELIGAMPVMQSFWAKYTPAK